MFDQVQATGYYRKMQNGRTSPLLLECEQSDGSTVEVVAKFSRGCSAGGLIREAITSMLAIDLELPVPDPYLVQLTPDFIDSIPDPAVATFLTDSDALGFGSKRLPDSFSQWTQPGGMMSDVLEQEALDIITLDCWISNADRRVSNPNLMTDGRHFAIFDHELALMPTLLGWTKPWLENALRNTKPPLDHVFFEHLRGRKSYATDPILDRLTEFSENRIADYINALPASWIALENVVEDVQDYLEQLRENAAGANNELRRALT